MLVPNPPSRAAHRRGRIVPAAGTAHAADPRDDLLARGTVLGEMRITAGGVGRGLDDLEPWM